VSSPNFFAELKRRSVYKVAVAYAVVAWLLIQIATQVFPFLQIPDWAIRLVIMLLALGFPIALVIAWAFELTPEGIKRAETAEGLAPRRRTYTWVYVVVIGGAISIGLFFLGRYTGPRLATESAAKSIAVLPFANLSEDKANAYFADGIQDEILTRLSKISDLKVISRTSTQQFQSKPGNIAEIAKQLGVAHVLEGSVQKAGDSVRVNVQLIKAEGDSHLWAETYDRKLLDTFAVESEVAGRIASSLAAKLTGREKKELARVPTDNPEAYDAYLRGLALDNSQAETELEVSRKSFRRAVELDPQFALAWAYLANREAWNYFVNHRTPEQLAVARQAAETAMKLAPNASESHAALGSVYYYCLQDFDRALAEFKKARELSPSSANAIVMTAMVKRRQGALDESIQLQIEAAAVDPRNPDVWVNLGRSYRGMRRFQEAREMFDRALAILPNEESILAQKIETYLAEGDLTTSAEALSHVTMPKSESLFGDHVTLFILRRDYPGAIAAITKHLDDETSPEDKQYAHLGIAFCQVLLGQMDVARPTLESIRQAFEERLRNGDQSIGLMDNLIDIYAVLGDRPAVERTAEKLLRDSQHDRWQLPNSEESVARGFAILRDADRALPHIERALSMPAQAGLTTAYLRLDPVWDRIRDDPRFQKLTHP
jgi:TolB-like protein/Flp pilus assembly protein TadD